MAKEKVFAGGFIRFLVIILFTFAIYLLCTDYMHITYNGAFGKLEECDIYTEEENSVAFEAVKQEDNNVIAGLVLKAKKDADYTEILRQASVSYVPSDSIYLHALVKKYETGEKQTIDEKNLVKLNGISKDDEINLMVMDDSAEEYFLNEWIVFDKEIFTVEYVYDTSKKTVVPYSAFDLLFGSESMENMNFEGNITALIFWLPPIIALLAYIFDRKSYIKNLIGMGMSVVSIFAVVYFIGGVRLARGSVLSIVLNLTLFILCLYPILLRKKDD